MGISVKCTLKDSLVYIGFMLYNGMSDTVCPSLRTEPFSLSTHSLWLVTTPCFAWITYFGRE